jgi:hypothetical protein
MADEDIQTKAMLPFSKPKATWHYWVLFVLGAALSCLALLLPGMILENALLPRPWTGPSSDYIYSEPRISIAADRLADNDPFFAKARRECGTKSVAERLFRGHNSYVRRVDEQIVQYDLMGHPYRTTSASYVFPSIISGFTLNEDGKSSQAQLDCLAKLGDPNTLQIYRSLDLPQLSQAKFDETARELFAQSNLRHLKRLEAWFAEYPISSEPCTNSNLPTYYVCGGVTGNILSSLAAAKITQACNEKTARAPSLMIEINSLLAQALQRMDPAGAKELMRSMTDENNSIGAFYQGRCLP